MNEDISLTVLENDVSLNVSDVPNLQMQVEENIMAGGTMNYNVLMNKPQINNVQLEGNKSFDDLGMSALSNLDIYNILK